MQKMVLIIYFRKRFNMTAFFRVLSDKTAQQTLNRRRDTGVHYHEEVCPQFHLHIIGGSSSYVVHMPLHIILEKQSDQQLRL